MEVLQRIVPYLFVIVQILLNISIQQDLNIHQIKLFPRNTESCDNSMIMKSEFLLESFNVSSIYECLHICLVVNQQHVCQINISKHVNPVTMMMMMRMRMIIQCHCSNVTSQYVILFPNRYLQCTNLSDLSQMKLYYRSDYVWNNMSSLERPLLFYSLDDVSELMNLGRLDSIRYSLQWKIGGGGYFDCPWKNGGRRKMIRLEPSQQPWLQVAHNLSLSSVGGFTWMIWFKKRDPSSSAMPLLENTDGWNQDFWMWNHDTAERLHINVNQKMFAVSNKFNQDTWNHLSVRVGSGVFDVFVNGTRCWHI
jgi:hypothetical protein